jgi:hypothetical protein
MLRITGLVAAAVLAAGTAGATLAHGTSVARETLYYGKTTQGLGVYIPIQGRQIPHDMRAYVLFWIYRRTRDATSEFHPGIYPGATSFRGGRLAYHHLAKLPGGTIEVWFQATLKQAGKVMTGSYREIDSGFSPVPRDTSTVRFTAVAYASEVGREWTGATSDAKQLRARVGYKLVPGRVVFNGGREREPKYTIAVPATTRPLACRNGDGTMTKIAASLPALSAELVGSEDFAASFSPKAGSLSTVAPAIATATDSRGASTKVELVVKRLAWLGGGLAATGTLSYEGTLPSETGIAACARVVSAFTLRPR